MGGTGGTVGHGAGGGIVGLGVGGVPIFSSRKRKSGTGVPLGVGERLGCGAGKAPRGRTGDAVGMGGRLGCTFRIPPRTPETGTGDVVGAGAEGGLTGAGGRGGWLEDKGAPDSGFDDEGLRGSSIRMLSF